MGKGEIMSNLNTKSMFTLGVFVLLGLSVLGYFIVQSVNVFKQYDRSVVVKGLSQKQFKADIVLWPIKFVVIDNDFFELNKKIESQSNHIIEFLSKNGIKKDEISLLTPVVVDKLANDYATRDIKYRYYGSRTINIYSKNVDKVRKLMTEITELNKKGIIFKINDYDLKVDYIFTRLNEVKPLMIEESTKNARATALKFAKDSNSKLGKIKKARQGQFSINDRDKNTPYIKKVRVVSTIEYYLND